MRLPQLRFLCLLVVITLIPLSRVPNPELIPMLRPIRGSNSSVCVESLWSLRRDIRRPALCQLVQFLLQFLNLCYWSLVSNDPSANPPSPVSHNPNFVYLLVFSNLNSSFSSFTHAQYAIWYVKVAMSSTLKIGLPKLL